MAKTLDVINISFVQAFKELRANTLRTSLSLMGITLGIFSIVAVLAVLDSLKDNFLKSFDSLGSDVLYVGRWPWAPEAGAYKWWEYMRRPSMSERELQAVNQRLYGLQYACLSLRSDRQEIHRNGNSLEGATLFAVTDGFDKLQNVEIADGRYLSAAEIAGGNSVVVIGKSIQDNVFADGSNPIGKTVSFINKRFTVVGVLKSEGENMVGFDFDDAVIIPYDAAASAMNLTSFNSDPSLVLKPKPGYNLDNFKLELEGVLRSERRVPPDKGNNFSINQLSQITARIDTLFGVVDAIGLVIGGFSLLVGAFGISNIMFVSVRERTRIIGLKKAIGARQRLILAEFLIESITLCVIGGALGIILVFLLSLVLTYGFDFGVTLSLKNIALGVSISAISGIIAGYVPARAASRLDPVVAIRST